MKISDALVLQPNSQWAFVGSGGKSSAIFSLARQYQKNILITTTTRLAISQAESGDHHIIVEIGEKLPINFPGGIVVVSGGVDKHGKVNHLEQSQLLELSEWATKNQVPLLIEADGSRLKPLKAPAAYEPAIPDFVNRVILVAGMSGFGMPLNNERVHRPEIYSALSKIRLGGKITAEGMSKVFLHPEGGLKNIPKGASKTLLLNQVVNEEKIIAGRKIARLVQKKFDHVILADLKSDSEVIASYQPIAGVILAAGGSTRLGRPKQFLNWHGKPFVRVVAENAIDSGLSPVIVVAGEEFDEIKKVLAGLPISIVENQNWQEGQGSSVAKGVKAIQEKVGGAIFLLVDQPQINHILISVIIDEHAISKAKIVAPLIDQQRGNPVLFDETTFNDLRKLTGEKGGRQLFAKYKADWVPWVDAGALLDVDTEEDYQRLLQRYS